MSHTFPSHQLCPPWVSVLFKIYWCVFVYTQLHVCLHLCMWVWQQGSTSGALLHYSASSILRQLLSLNLKPASTPKDFFCPRLPRAASTACDFIQCEAETGCYGTELRASCLHGTCFTQKATSRAPQIADFSWSLMCSSLFDFQYLVGAGVRS